VRAGATLRLARSHLAGGGFDVFCGLPLYLLLKKAGKTVHLANLSSGALGFCDAENPVQALWRITSRTAATKYFPEMHLSAWLTERFGETPIFAIEPSGARRVSAAYEWLARTLRPDAIVLVELPKAGLTAEDIDLVVCSHLHTDHCGCNSFFRRATVVCSAEELTSAQSDTSGAYIAEDWEGSRPIETIAGQRDLLGDGRMTLIEAPGHTPGMLVAHVVLDTQTFVLASDAAPVRETLDQRYAPKGTWNVDIALKSLDEIARLERDGSKVIFGHDETQWRQIRTGAEFYE